MMSYRLVAASLSLLSATLLQSAPASAQLRSGQHPASNSVPSQGNFGDTFNSQGGISGTVRAPDGHGLPNASIEARDIEGKNRSFLAHSDSRGEFVIRNVPPGSYEIRASSGVDEARQRVQVGSGFGDTNVDLRVSGTTAEHRTGNNTTVSIAQYNIPAKARSLYDKATQLISKGKIDEAHEKLNAALEACPKFAEALTLRGILLDMSGKREQAITDYQQALQYDASYPLAYIALASLFNSIGRFNDSLPLLSHAERLAPNAWQTYFEMARAEIGKGDYNTALHNVDRASELQGGPQKETPEIHLIRGYSLVGLKQIQRATQEIEIFLSRGPKGPVADNARHVLDRLRQQDVNASR